MKSSATGLLFCILSALALTTAAAQPEPAKSKMMKVSGAGLEIGTNDQGKIIRKIDFFLKLKKIPREGAFLVIEFENPADPAKRIVHVESLKPRQDQVLVISDPVEGFECRQYKITAKIFADADQKLLLDELTQEYEVTLSDRQMAGKSIMELVVLLKSPVDQRCGKDSPQNKP